MKMYRYRHILAALFFLISGCAHHQTVVLSIQELDCASCGNAMVATLQATDGVNSAEFNKLKAEIAVEYNPTQTSPANLVECLKEQPFKVVAEAGLGTYLQSDMRKASGDIKFIVQAGEYLDITQNLVPGKVTLVDFYADWCGPCRQLDAAIKPYLIKDSGLALRKINIVDWDTPISKAYLKQAEALPFVMVFSASGKHVGSVNGLLIEKLLRTIQEAKSEAP